MLPERRYEPGLNNDLGALFQEILVRTKEESEGMQKCVREYAKRGQERMKQPITNGGASPTEFAQMILRLAQFCPEDFEKIPFLREVRAKIEDLLGQKPGVVIPLDRAVSGFSAIMRMKKEK